MPNKKKVSKQLKLEMMRYCLLWGYSVEMQISYFKQRGFELSASYAHELKAELESDESVQGWYTDVSMRMMEREQKLDFEQVVELEKLTMTEIAQLNMTNVYIVAPKKNPKDPDVLILNDQHDSALMAKLISTLVELKKVKSDMLAATPVVQAIMVKKRKEEERKRLAEEEALATIKSKV